MKDFEKEKIKELRTKGYGYKKIASEMNMNLSTIKSFCKRENIVANEKIVVNEVKEELINEPVVEVVENKPAYDDKHCLCCGNELPDKKTTRKMKFCSSECRMKFWNKHRDELNKKNAKTVVCPHCHKSFKVYENSSRKYCSIDCYQKERLANG